MTNKLNHPQRDLNWLVSHCFNRKIHEGTHTKLKAGQASVDESIIQIGTSFPLKARSIQLSLRGSLAPPNYKACFGGKLCMLFFGRPTQNRGTQREKNREKAQNAVISFLVSL